MMFDEQAVLAEILANTPATPVTPATNRTNVADAAGVAVHRPETETGDVLPFVPRTADDMFAMADLSLASRLPGRVALSSLTRGERFRSGIATDRTGASGVRSAAHGLPGGPFHAATARKHHG